jgi:hypothetical protein
VTSTSTCIYDFLKAFQETVTSNIIENTPNKNA